MHQGDSGEVKGVYHINFVDETTQWQIVGCAERISESFLIPVMEGCLGQFPFVIKEFHSDNGSEFINQIVAKLLNTLLIEQSKSRSRRTNDNALVEGKNGAVIRKWMGHNYIPGKFAEAINFFYKQFLNVYLNFHRPCGFSTDTVSSKGKIKKKYDTYLTPYESSNLWKIKSVSKARGKLLKRWTTSPKQTKPTPNQPPKYRKKKPEYLKVSVNINLHHGDSKKSKKNRLGVS